MADLRLSAGEVAAIVPPGTSPGPGQIKLVTPGGESAGREFTVKEGLASGGFIEVNAVTNGVKLDRALTFIAGATTPSGVDDDDLERDPYGNVIGPLDPPFEEGDFMTDFGIYATPRFPFGAAFADTVHLTGTAEGDFVLAASSSLDLLVGEADGSSVIEGSLEVAGNQNHVVNLTLRGQLLVSGNDNEISVTVANSPNHGVVITGHGNHLTLRCERNTYDGVVINGGRFNAVMVWAAHNGGNGVTLRGGARGNVVSLTTGQRDPVTGRGLARSGNGAHGVALLGEASANMVLGVDVIAGNAVDGVHLSGPGVTDNVLGILDATANGGNGFTVSARADRNRFEQVRAENSGESGFLIRSAHGTVVNGLHTGDNSHFGLRITGVVDAQTRAQFDSRWNRTAGLRLDGGTSLVTCEGASQSDTIGLQLADATTASNTVTLRIRSALAHGAEIVAARRNRLRLDVSGCGLDGVRLAGGAAENNLRDLRANNNGGHGLLLTDPGTSANEVPIAKLGVPEPPEPSGNGGDGIRVENGASRNWFGNAAGEGCIIGENGGVGIRFTGAGTLGNGLANAHIENTPAPRAQSAGVVIEAGAAGTLLSSNLITGHPDAGVIIADTAGIALGPAEPGTGWNRIEQNQVGIRLTGTGTMHCRVFLHELRNNAVGVAVENGAAQNTLGPINRISGGVTGIRVNGGKGNVITQNQVLDHSGAGVSFSGGAVSNVVSANFISRNQVGVEVNGLTTVRNTITVNAITANLGKGIRLVNGGNRELPAPAITGVGSQRVTGYADGEDHSTIELFRDPADEGKSYMAPGRLRHGSFEVRVDNQPGYAPGLVGKAFFLHATATDTEGNTSEFGDLEAAGGGSAPLAFTSTRDGNREIFLTDGFGAAATRLTAHPADDFHPALSPDHARVAFVSMRDGNAEVYLLTVADTNNVTRLTTHAAADNEPAWSPHGTEFAFVSERDGDAEIYVMKSDGSDVRRLTFDAAEDRSPTWSADGTKLAFSSTRSGNAEIWVMNSDGSRPTRLTWHDAPDTEPAWSPDGQYLAFVSQRDGNKELYTMRAAGTDLLRLTDHPAADVSPTWFPDSQSLAFASDRDQGFELYLSPRTGGPADRITVSAGDNVEPSATR
jgi:Tol biopolymer transport system component